MIITWDISFEVNTQSKFVALDDHFFQNPIMYVHNIHDL